MATDSISVISVDYLIYTSPSEKSREVKENNTTSKDNTTAIRAFETSTNNEIQESSENESKNNAKETKVLNPSEK